MQEKIKVGDRVRLVNVKNLDSKYASRKNTTAIVIDAIELYIYFGINYRVRLNHILVRFESDNAYKELYIGSFVKVIDDKEKICKKSLK